MLECAAAEESRTALIAEIFPMHLPQVPQAAIYI
jgi:hypothetical protein